MLRKPLRTSLAVLLGITSVAGVALAHSGGISGYSGKQGTICTSCHQGGPEPVVKLSGPTSLDAGMSAVYTFHINTTNLGVGMNAATTDGKLTPDDAGVTRIEPYTNFQTDETTDEITHNGPQHVLDGGADGGYFTFSFTLTAPEYGGPISLYAAGNAVNLNDDTDGDNAQKDKIDIMVYGPPKPPTPDASAPAPATTQPHTGVDAGTVPSLDAGAPRSGAAPTDDSGCSIGWADQTTGGTFGAGGMFSALVALSALTRRRRRRG
jgi:hypothetical protein